jgi:hypothetical protein
MKEEKVKELNIKSCTGMHLRILQMILISLEMYIYLHKNHDDNAMLKDNNDNIVVKELATLRHHQDVLSLTAIFRILAVPE